MAIQIAQDPTADELLDSSDFALLIGMMLDQQFPMEHAFRGPAKMLERLGSFTPAEVAGCPPEKFAELASTPPAIHRFPQAMATRMQDIAQVVLDTYGGETSRIWTDAVDGKDLMKRLTALPGFGKQKGQIFVALLAKQRGVRPRGWEQAAGDYALGGHRSVADVVDEHSLQKVRDFKKAAKAVAKK